MKKITFCLIILLIACEDRTRTSNFTYFQNDSGHAISIKLFFKGNITSHLSFDLSTNEKQQVVYSQYPGMNGDGESYADLAQLGDSILVIYDNLDTVVHYSKLGVIGGAKKFILYNSSRSLYNPNNFIKTITKKTSNSVTYNFLYTFTQQDYLDAQ